jgi:hypothetical protein
LLRWVNAGKAPWENVYIMGIQLGTYVANGKYHSRLSAVISKSLHKSFVLCFYTDSFLLDLTKRLVNSRIRGKVIQPAQFWLMPFMMGSRSLMNQRLVKAKMELHRVQETVTQNPVKVQKLRKSKPEATRVEAGVTQNRVKVPKWRKSKGQKWSKSKKWKNTKLVF